MFPSSSAKLFPDIDPNPFGRDAARGRHEGTHIVRTRAIDELPETRSAVPTGELRTLVRTRHIRFAGIICVALLMIFAGRVAYMQLVRGASFAARADANRLRTIPLHAPRGLILDRNGIALAKNVPSFSVYLSLKDLPNDAADREMLLNELGFRTGLSRGTLDARITSGAEVGASLLLVQDDVHPKVALALRTRATRYPGLIVEERYSRAYTSPTPEERNAFAHIVGYEGPLDAQEFTEKKPQGYTLVDRIGKTGIEWGGEALLRGTPGVKQIEINAIGHTLETRAVEPPIAGETIELTIDAHFQEFAERALRRATTAVGGRGAALVALDPTNGEVHALVSYPSYDHGAFSRGMREDAFAALIEDTRAPLLNRAIAGAYPSGSIAKLFVAVAALDEGIVTPQTTLTSTGGIRVGRWFFPDWKAGGHGPTNLTKAIAESVNTFFYIVGGGFNEYRGLGVGRLAQWFQKFGFGAKTGVELYGEKAGFVPTPEWKKNKHGQEWYIGDTYNISIGQGDLLVTPLQVARATAALTNGGILVRPHMLKARYDHVGRREALGKKEEGSRVANAANVQSVLEGMRAAVERGSAQALRSLPLYVAGKTGTAQWARGRRPHAWFTGFARDGARTLVLTVLIEEGGEGSTAAVPLAKEIFRWWHEHGAHI